MFCSNCGKPLGDEAKFCPDCGTQMAAKKPAEALVETPVEVPVEVPVETPVEAPAKETVEAPAKETVEAPAKETVTVPPVASVEDVPARPKKKIGKKLLVAGIVAIALVVALVVSAFASPFMGNLLAKTLMSPKKYLQHVQKNSAEDFSKEFAAQLALIKNAYTVEPMGVHGNMTLTLGEGLKELIEAESAEAAMVTSWVDSVGMDLDAATDGSRVGMTGKLQLNGTDLMEGQFVFDFEDGMIYITVPEISGTAVGISLPSEFTYLFNNQAEMLEMVEQILAVIPSEEVMEKLICRYLDVVVGELSDVSRDAETVSAGGVTEKVTVLSAKISEKTLLNVAEAVMKELKDDEDVKDIIKGLSSISALGIDGDELYDDFRDGIEDVLEEIEEEEPSSKALFTLKVFVDSVGDIVGIGAKVADVKAEASFLALEKGSKQGLALKVDGPGVNVAFEGDSEVAGGKRNGTYSFKYDDMEIVTATLSNIDDEKWNAGLLDGTVTVSLSEEVENLLGYADAAEYLSGARLEMTGKQASQYEGEAEMALYLNNKLFLSMKAEATSTGNTTVTLPGNYVYGDSESELAAWLSEAEVDAGAIIDRFRSAGMPESMTALLEQSVASEEETMETEMMTGTVLDEDFLYR
ncbi:MAG: zinc ribbon domain-containing protein [Ruminococcaceae bacterium]|nr:zinc ribbon domain-containing protein [Oscillospiraceae bacterium]